MALTETCLALACHANRYPFVHALVDGHAKGKANTPYLERLAELRAAAVMEQLLEQVGETPLIHVPHSTIPPMSADVVAAGAQGVAADHVASQGSGAAGRGAGVHTTPPAIRPRTSTS